jgi:glycosyltransferase involved in cell wall biosynthesis
LKKKVLFITHSSAAIGGAEDEFERLLGHFSQKKENYEIHGLFPKGPRAEVYSSYCTNWAFIREGYFPVIFTSFTEYAKYFVKSLVQSFQIIRFTCGRKYDLTAINVVVMVIPAILMALLRSKVIVFIREDIYPVLLRHLIYKVLSIFCTYFIPNSVTKERDFIVTTGNLHVEHIYPGLESDFHSSEGMLSTYLGNDTYRKLSDTSRYKFVNPAIVINKKNQLLILRALKIIVDSRSVSIPFVVFVGYYDSSSHYHKMLVEYIEQNSLGELCIFLGPLERHLLYELYEMVDSVILSSYSEGMPLVLLEALKFQRPIISTKVGGIPEIIVDNVNGLLIDFDEEDLAKSMLKLMNDEDFRESIKANSILTFREKFDLEKAMERTERIFHAVSAA